MVAIIGIPVAADESALANNVSRVHVMFQAGEGEICAQPHELRGQVRRIMVTLAHSKPVEKVDRMAKVSRGATALPSHLVVEGDARNLSFIPRESVHFVCTSPPYGSLIQYPEHENQLGNIESYQSFLLEMDKVWSECLRILVPGGRVACVVGDVCISRRKGGRHHVLPLSADFQVCARRVGFDNLTPIRWLKISNMKLEASKSGRYLGKPNLPNGIVKNDIENILFFRKPGGYRKPTKEMERLSRIETEDYVNWFSPVWSDIKGQRRKDHPAPYPSEIPKRLIRMFSFAGDTVVDPFGGTGSTAFAALQTGRSSISVEIEPAYVTLMESRLRSLGSVHADVRVRRKPEKFAAQVELGRT